MRQKTKKNKLKPIPRKIVLAIVAVTVCLITAGYFIYSVEFKTPKQSGVLDDSQTSSGESLHSSLDLRLARKASYPSTVISLVKDMGTNDGIKQQIVSFGVLDDGLTEYGLMYTPTNPKPANGFPVVIICHGYISPADYSTTLGYLSDMQTYAKNGFVVIKPDFRGQGLSTGQGQPDGAYYSMAYNTDLMSLISAVKDTGNLDKNNINLWGHSMGAYIALRASVVSSDIKNTILLSGPVGSLKQIYLSYVPPSDENNPYALLARQAAFSKYGTPGDDTAFWKNASPTTYLATTHTKFEINVGSQDSVVPPALSAELDADLASLNHSHEYYVYSDGRHSLTAERQLIWSRSLSLLKKT